MSQACRVTSEGCVGLASHWPRFTTASSFPRGNSEGHGALDHVRIVEGEIVGTLRSPHHSEQLIGVEHVGDYCFGSLAFERFAADVWSAEIPFSRPITRVKHFALAFNMLRGGGHGVLNVS
jgi:hypothetical protein